MVGDVVSGPAEEVVNRRPIISLDALVPLGLFAAVIGGVVAAAVWAARVDMRQTLIEEAQKRQDQIYQTIASELKEVRSEIRTSAESLRRDIEAERKEFVEVDLLALYIDLLRSQNPEMKFPPIPKFKK